MVQKPWERYDPKTYMSIRSLVESYFIMMGKIVASYLHGLCYFFMLLALMMNGGLLYMMYPALLFGIALVEEQRPGRRFWYFVIYYTQALLII